VPCIVGVPAFRPARRRRQAADGRSLDDRRAAAYPIRQPSEI